LVRIAVWGPLPPDEGGPAEENALVLATLARRYEVVAVVRDEIVERTHAPEGVSVVGDSSYGPFGVDLDLYHLANQVRPNVRTHRQVLARPGILVLHEPSLSGLYGALFGRRHKALLKEEAWRETGRPEAALDRASAGSTSVVDPFGVLYSPRLVAASLCSVVDSQWAARTLAARCPRSSIEVVPRAAAHLQGAAAHSEASLARSGTVVLAYGAPAELVATVVESLGRARGELGHAPIVLVGPPGDLSAPYAMALARQGGMGERTRLVEAPRSAARLAPLFAQAALAVLLEWPTHGGTSPLVAAALCAGTPVVVADLPQYEALDALAVQRVPVRDPSHLASALEALVARLEGEGALQAAKEAARRAGAAHRLEAVVDRYCEILDRHLPADRHRRSIRRRAMDASWPPAVNVIASFEATTGLAEAARRSVRALAHAGVRVALEDYDYGWAPRQAHRLDSQLRALPRGRPYDIELCSLNVNELHIVPKHYLRPPHHHRHLVGLWFWELPELPRSLQPQVARVDEVWAPSEFVAEAFAPHTPRPVRVVPCVVEPERDERLGREHFGLSSSRRCFFFNFDANSTLARKNPFAVIEAFRRAFPPSRRGDVQLVMKTLNLDRYPEAAAALREAMEEVGGLIIEQDLTAEAMAALTFACDVYVSLHRAEGFGLGIAEAMYFGKPAIATAYSGNLSFMSFTNSCLVGYTMTEVNAGELRYNPGAERVYEPGQRWAEPDLDEAASWMRFCHEEESAAARLAAAGARTIRERCSASAVGSYMRELLEGIVPE
jgi:glycosyltransferase involved in cell wall biosynthesis